MYTLKIYIYIYLTSLICIYSSINENYEADLVNDIIKRIHESQCKGLVVSPVSIISAIILYGRATNGVCIGKIKELMEWLRSEMSRNGYTVDWQGKKNPLKTYIL